MIVLSPSAKFGTRRVEPIQEVRYPRLLGCSRTVGVDEEGPWKILGANIGEIGETYVLVLGNYELRFLSSSEILRRQ